jgi:hypothetical protein
VCVLDHGPQLTLRQEAVKLDVPSDAELLGEFLGLAAERVLPDDVQTKLPAAIRQHAQGSQQRALILDAIEARDMDEPQSLVRRPPNRRSQRPTLEVDAKRHSLRVHAVPCNERTHRIARSRYSRRVPKHRALQKAPAPRR